jgi:hypothetical protein
MNVLHTMAQPPARFVVLSPLILTSVGEKTLCTQGDYPLEILYVPLYHLSHADYIAHPDLVREGLVLGLY